MGFAVVAEEVRNLAQRSSKAARETSASIEDSIRKSENGVELNTKVGAGLMGLADRTRRLHDLVVQIAGASHDQNKGIEQINGAVLEMSQVTQKNAASTEEMASASAELKSQADSIRQAIGELVKLLGTHQKLESMEPAQAASKTVVQSAPSRSKQARIDMPVDKF